MSQRIREVLPDIYLGKYATGPKNSLTDVKGVLVHTQSVHKSERKANAVINTGVTTILPRKDFFNKACFSGIFRFNGSGEMTDSHWIEETGLLNSPIVITNSFAVGSAFQGVYEYAVKNHQDDNGLANWFMMPVIAETYDGFLNDIGAFAITPEMIVEGIENASDAIVPEGNSGGGTGMICHWFKGGTGSSSRLVPGKDATGNDTTFTIAALVQANYGGMEDLRIAGAPIGRIMKEKGIASVPKRGPKQDGSIIIIIATDAPLSALQLQRLAKRATVGLSRVGGYGGNASGDIFLAFSTANDPPSAFDNAKCPTVLMPMQQINDASISELFDAASDAVEESIYNALCMAEDMVGPTGVKVKALDLEKLKELMQKYL